MKENERELKRKYAEFYRNRAKRYNRDTLYNECAHPLLTFFHNSRVNKIVQYVSGSTRVLDIGCGHGHVIVKVAPRVGDVVGVEIAPTRIKKTKLRIIGYEIENADLVLCDALDLCFRDEIFDAIVLTEVIEHVISDNRLLQECYRVLKSPGTLVVTSPNALALYNIVREMALLIKGKHTKIIGEFPEALLKKSHVRSLDYHALKKKLIERDFKVLDFIGIGFSMGVPRIFLEKMVKRSKVFKIIAFTFFTALPRLFPLFSSILLVVARRTDGQRQVA